MEFTQTYIMYRRVSCACSVNVVFSFQIENRYVNQASARVLEFEVGQNLFLTHHNLWKRFTIEILKTQIRTYINLYMGVCTFWKVSEL